MQMAPSTNILDTQTSRKMIFLGHFLTDFESWVHHLWRPLLAATVEFLALCVIVFPTHRYHPPKFDRIPTTAMQF